MVTLSKNGWESQAIVYSINWYDVKKKEAKFFGSNMHRNKYNAKPKMV